MKDSKKKLTLTKSLKRRDVYFFLVCTLVGLDTIGSVASRGGEGFFWLIVVALLFFVPYAFLVAELGSAFPQEGGPYVWTKLALGKPIAAINAVFYWISNPIWLGGALTITAITTWDSFVFPLSEIQKYSFGLALIWLCVLVSVLSFGIGKWITIAGAWVRIALLSLFTITVVLYGMKHGIHGQARLPSSFMPTYDGFLGVVPFLVFNFVGFELPSAAGEEMVNPKRDVPVAVLRGAITSILCYGVPILAILLVLPKEQITGLRGFVDAMKIVFTVYGDTAGSIIGKIAALGFIVALATSGVTWIMGSDRSQAIACRDGAGPEIFGVFGKKWGTPVPINIASGVISTVVMFAAFLVSGHDAEKFFAAVLSLGISTTTISYLSIFPALYLLRRLRPDTERPFRIAGKSKAKASDRWALVITLLTFAWALLASVCLVWPGFGARSNPDAALPAGFVVLDPETGRVLSSQRFLFEMTQVVPLVVVLLISVIFLTLGKRQSRKKTGVLGYRAEPPAV